MKEQIINRVLGIMRVSLDNSQLLQLKQALELCLMDEKQSVMFDQEHGAGNDILLHRFINAKRVEGCSEKTIRYYETTVRKMMTVMNKSVVQITTEDIRNYLSEYRQSSECSKANIDNLRRIFSSFFSWLENEDIIMKSPVRRIRKVKTEKQFTT